MESSGDPALSNTPVENIRNCGRSWEDIFKRQNWPCNIHPHGALQNAGTRSGVVLSVCGT